MTEEPGALELHYHEIFSLLNAKLDRLIYLTKLESLNSQSEQEIEAQYQNVVENLAPIPAVSEPNSQKSAEEVLNFLQLQTSILKTNALTVNYLQLILPILKSIHTQDGGGAEMDQDRTAAQISSNLAQLYSIDSVKKLLTSYKHETQRISTDSSLQVEVNELLQEVIQPKLAQLHKINLENVQKFQRLKELELELELGNSDISSVENRLIFNQFQEIQLIWRRVAVYVDLLPVLVLSTATDSNWADNEKMAQIVVEAGELDQELADKNHPIHVDLDRATVYDLFDLDLH